MASVEEPPFPTQENNRLPPGMRQQLAQAVSGGGKTPPHSMEAEESVLGGVLFDNEAFNAIAELQLAPEDFYKEGNQRVFRAIANLISRGEPADLVTVTNGLRNAGDLERCGGARYLTELADRAFTSANVPYYAKIVKEKAVLRHLIRTASEVSTEALTGVQDQEAFLDEVEKKVFAITSQKQSHNFDALKDILLRNFAEIEKNAATKSKVTGVPTGFIDLDNKTTGWKPGQLIIIAARPGMGKTSFMLNVAANCAKTTDKPYPVAFFSMEMSKEELSMRLLAMESRVDSYRLKTGRLQEQDWQNLQRGAGKLSEAPIFIDDTPALNVMEVKSRARRIQSIHGLSLVVVDYLQLMRGTSIARGNNMNREQEISEISRGLKALAKELEVPVIAASQLNRGVEARNDKRPMLSDLRESGAIEQDADMVVFIHREEQYNRDSHQSDEPGLAEIIIGKHRAGSVGSVKLAWLGQYTTFENLAVDAGH